MNGDTSMNNFPIGDKPSKGPMLGTIIIVAVIIIGGIYIITSRRGDEVMPTDKTSIPTGVTPAGNDQMAIVGLSSVEAELNASKDDLVNLEAEIK